MREKMAIRRDIRLLTQQLSDERRQDEAAAVTRQLEDIIRERKPATVAAFMPLPDEIPIDIDRLSRLCRLIIPRISTATPSMSPMEDEKRYEMEFFDYSPDTTRRGSYGIDEPQQGVMVDAREIDLMIVPGVAFTSCGKRLGRGKGFYDRYLSREGFRAQCVGVCFCHQLLQELPAEPHDHTIHKVITAKSK